MLTWRLLVSPWSQALLVCFCFSAEEGRGSVCSCRAQQHSQCPPGQWGGSNQCHPQCWTLVTLRSTAHTGRTASCPGHWGHHPAALGALGAGGAHLGAAGI